ncbi:MAG TPA: pyridoxal-phosphate dependent enzyme [Thermoanaerobaculia bacterium]|jgi:cysteine synthase|nr:pyridoxal-phosphate dependent enzyme [Thermoanaerobaculia bacterium]
MGAAHVTTVEPPTAGPRSARRFADVHEMVGNTPHLRVRCAEHAAAEFFFKLESHNPTGSIKDRTCVRLIADRLRAGDLRPGMTLLDASSGNMGCAIAYFGRLAGYPATVVSSSKLTADKLGFMQYFGGAVEQVGDFTIEGNHRCREMAAADPGRYCFLDQLHSWGNPQAHYQTTGPEILAAFPDLALLVGSLGSGGSLLGTARFLKERKPGLQVVAVEAAPGTRLPGTGAFDDGDYVTPFIREGYERGTFDHRRKIEYEQAAARTLELRDQGLFAGLQTGGVYQAAVAAARELGVRGEVVILSGDTGWKNMQKLMAIAV